MYDALSLGGFRRAMCGGAVGGELATRPSRTTRAQGPMLSLARSPSKTESRMVIRPSSATPVASGKKWGPEWGLAATDRARAR